MGKSKKSSKKGAEALECLTEQEVLAEEGIDQQENPNAVPKAPEGMRYVGFCKSCRDFVELGPTFSCMDGGHHKDQIAVAILYDKDDPKPHMPKLNLGALFMPALWGPGHGQWYMILFYPLWLFLDRLIYGAVYGYSSKIVAIFCALVMAGFTVFYALNANKFGYVKAAATTTPEQYMKRERVWTIIMVAIAIVFLVFATWYNVAVRPTLPLDL